MKVLFLTQTAEIGAAARYRVYQFIDYLQAKGFDCSVSPGSSNRAIRNLTLKGTTLNRIIAYSQPFIYRILNLPQIRKYDIIFLQRDILIHFPPLFEWIISRINKNFIFDFDDALYTQPKESRYSLFYYLKGKNKIPSILKMAKYVIAGNNHLKEYALQYNKQVEVIPISIDTERYYAKTTYEFCSSPVIGWIGRPGSFFYLEQMKDVFKQLSQRYDFSLKVVGAKDNTIEGVKIITKEWKLEEEIDDLRSFDIGIMPLTNDEWTQGKSGTKVLQYMAAGVPVVGQAVGANCDIIKDGENGFLAKTKEQWLKKISLLIENQTLRKNFGTAGRIDVERHYSIKANAPKLLNVLRKVSLTEN